MSHAFLRVSREFDIAVNSNFCSKAYNGGAVYGIEEPEQREEVDDSFSGHRHGLPGMFISHQMRGYLKAVECFDLKNCL